MFAIQIHFTSRQKYKLIFVLEEESENDTSEYVPKF